VGFTLTAETGAYVDVDVGNWHPTVELLGAHDLLDEATLELLHYSVHTRVDARCAERIATFLDGYLERMTPDERVWLDGTTAAEPDPFAIHEDDMRRNYSATDAWLAEFRDFCRDSGGFVVD
jgi:hypothetical protein